MDTLLRAGIAVTLIAGLTRAAELRSAEANKIPTRGVYQDRSRPQTSEPAAPCPPGTLPDANVCIPVPETSAGGPALSEERNSHHDRLGRLQTYDQIPRRPERPADFRSYLLPVPALPGQALIASGYDLERPDAEQRRGSTLKAVGHGGVDLAQKRGTRVELVALENQVGDAEVLATGVLFGNSVVTRHTVREAGTLREYLVIYGHLDSIAPGLTHGLALKTGAFIGAVGDSGSPGAVHLHLEVRRARTGVDVSNLPLGQVNNNAKTVACDPRNVLVIR